MFFLQDGEDREHPLPHETGEDQHFGEDAFIEMWLDMLSAEDWCGQV